MKWCTFFFAVLPIAAFGQSAQLDMVGPMLANHQAGIICAPPSMGTAPAPDTIAGNTHVFSEKPTFVSTNKRVPAVLGIGFGVKSQALDPAGIPQVTMTISHPEMGKTKATAQSFATRISGDHPSLTFYQFDFNYELVVGLWQMEASQGDTVIYRSTFEVVPPSQIPELASVCGFEDLLS